MEIGFGVELRNETDLPFDDDVYFYYFSFF